MSAIEAKGLTKRFGKFTAVDRVSFEVRRGEIFGFLGPNGAGKTTTISMLTTMMRPSEGEARVAGFDVVREAAEVRRRIGILFQESTVDRELTGWENLWIHGRIYGVRPGELKARIAELLKFVELDGWANAQVKRYSGGMVRRLEIARTLIHCPEVLFLDEPTLGLDPQSRARVWDYIAEVRRREGVTIFLTTHYMEEADALCDRVAIIDHGRIIAMGPPEELKARYSLETAYIKASDGPIGRLLEEVKAMPEVEWAGPVEGGTIAICAKRASRLLPEVCELALRLGVRVDEAIYRPPTLESVFLSLTGRSLRDVEASPFDHIRARMVRGRGRG